MRMRLWWSNPTRNGGCTKLLIGVIVLDWYKRVASVLPQFWVLSEMSVIITQSSHWTVRSAKLASWDRWNVPRIINLITDLAKLNPQLSYELFGLFVTEINVFSGVNGDN